MKRAVLFGAGQIGSMIARLVGSDFCILCFIDNSPSKWGKTHLGIPIECPDKIKDLHPDAVFLCVLDKERSLAMSQQLHSLGYSGSIILPDALQIFDPRIATMRLLAEQINQEQIPGDIAELGVFRGGFASLISAAFPDRRFHLFDTFCGFSDPDIAIEQAGHYSKAQTGDFADTSVEFVRKRLPYPKNAVFYQGFFPDTFQNCHTECFCFVSIDADLYAPTAAALPLFWERLSPGGVLMIHDVNSTQFTGAGKAVREFCRETGILSIPVCDLHGSVLLRK